MSAGTEVENVCRCVCVYPVSGLCKSVYREERLGGQEDEGKRVK